MAIHIEISLLVDTGCKTIEEAYAKFNEFNGTKGKLIMNTIEKKVVDLEVEDYFIKSYIDDEAC